MEKQRHLFVMLMLGVHTQVCRADVTQNRLSPINECGPHCKVYGVIVFPNYFLALGILSHS